MFRQGDLLVVRAWQMPVTALRVDHCVLAHGETTGHTHRIEIGAEQFVTPEGVRYVRVLRDFADLLHPEHGTVRLPGPAVYRVIRQREYEPDMVRTVSD